MGFEDMRPFVLTHKIQMQLDRTLTSLACQHFKVLLSKKYWPYKSHLLRRFERLLTQTQSLNLHFNDNCPKWET